MKVYLLITVTTSHKPDNNGVGFCLKVVLTKQTVTDISKPSLLSETNDYK
jgi:hypothetical protein